MAESKRPYLTFSQKVFIIITIFSATFLYSIYQKNVYEGFVNKAPSLILEELPEFEALDIYTNEVISKMSFIGNHSGLVVHFWGTWCAPCEAELPSFLEFSKNLEDKNITVLVLAVNDELKAVKKFLKRFKKSKLNNVIFALDKDGDSLPLFGSVKVPETYLFSSKLRHLEKFVGPQEWTHTSYEERVLRLLQTSTPEKLKKIESH